LDEMSERGRRGLERTVAALAEAARGQVLSVQGATRSGREAGGRDIGLAGERLHQAVGAAPLRLKSQQVGRQRQDARMDAGTLAHLPGVVDEGTGLRRILSLRRREDLPGTGDR